MADQQKIQHTPAPWRVDDDLIFSHKGLCVANCACEGQSMSYEGRQANARLIAAAPDLLEALIELDQHCQAMGAYGDAKGTFQVIQSAIARATGAA